MDDQTNQTVGFTRRDHVVQDLASGMLEHLIHVYHYILVLFASFYHPTQCPSSLVPFLSSNGFFPVTYIVFSFQCSFFLPTAPFYLERYLEVQCVCVRENLNPELTYERTHNICLPKTDF